MVNKNKMININCILCGKNDTELVFSRIINTGSKLGKIKVNNVMCKNCGLMYMNPRPSTTSLQRYYLEENKASGSTYHSTEEGARHDILIKERKKFILTHLQKKHYGKLLEIGCGNGDLLSSLHISNWKLYGIEPSANSAKIAQKRGLKVIQGTLENTNFNMEKFDIICCISTLEHIPNPDLAIQKMLKYLKENGIIIIEVPNSAKPEPQISEFYSFEHLIHFTYSTLERLLAKYDLKIIKIDKNISIPNLRIITKIQRGYSKSFIQTDERQILLSALLKYKLERKKIEKIVVKQFQNFLVNWKEQKKRIAIYGAGIHSLFLLETVNLKDFITCFIDSDPKKHNTKFLKWKVYSPNLIDTLKLDVIIISSKVFQEEIFHSIKHYQKKRIEIIKCYN